MTRRGIGTAVAKSPMDTASGSPTSAVWCFMPVSGIASRCYVWSIEIQAGSDHSYVGGHESIHDSEPASKVIRRELSIGIPQLDGMSFPALRLGRPNGANCQTGLIDSPGLTEWQPVRCAGLSFDNLLEKTFQLGVLIVAAKAQADRRVESIEAAGAFVLEPSL